MNLNKGIAIHAVFLIVVFLLLILILSGIFGSYIEIQNCEVAKIACLNRQKTHCFKWWKNDHTFSGNEPTWEPVKICNEEGKLVVDCEKPSALDCADMLG